MKSNMKRQGSTALPRFVVGAVATAGASAASGATVQITLTGNKISSTGDQLVADLTGDTVDDLTLTGRYIAGGGSYVEFRLYGLRLWASFSGEFFGAGAKFASGYGTPRGSERDELSISYLNPITFSDSRINGGSPTEGWLQVNAFNTSTTSHTVELSRLIFDDASTRRPGFTSIPGVQNEWQVAAVPEPGSNLALLALGAGGLTLRRRLKRAA